VTGLTQRLCQCSKKTYKQLIYKGLFKIKDGKKRSEGRGAAKPIRAFLMI